jgi:hypothetical protein
MSECTERSEGRERMPIRHSMSERMPIRYRMSKGSEVTA